ISVDKMVGTSIDVFHKNPAHQRRLLADPRNLPHRATIRVGPEKLNLLVTAMTDGGGKYLGPMLTWEFAELESKVDAMLEVVRAARAGDLTKAVTVSGQDAIGQMGEGLGTFFNDLRQSVALIAQNAKTLGVSSDGLTSVSQTMAATADETSAQANVVS